MKRVFKAISEGRERLKNLQRWLADEQIQPESKEGLKGCLWIAENAASLHAAYHHYTTCEAFCKIFRSETERSIRLSRLASARLNDGNECDKYSMPKTAQHTFVCCFNHEGAESANLWYLYAKGSPRAMRITFPAKEFAEWVTDLRKQGVLVTDVVYAAVRGGRDDYPQDRQNTLCREDVKVHVENLSDLLEDESLVGRLKDYEWRSERETRFLVRDERDERFKYLEIPTSLIKKLRITMSPWASDEDYDETKECVAKTLGFWGWKPTTTTFRSSVLTHAMESLRQK